MIQVHYLLKYNTKVYFIAKHAWNAHLLLVLTDMVCGDGFLIRQDVEDLVKIQTFPYSFKKPKIL